MSAPAVAPRPVVRPAPGRPPAGRTTQARPAPGRTSPGRATPGRAQAGPTQGRAGQARATTGAATAAALRAPARQAPAEARPRMRVVERPDLAPRRAGFVVACTALLGSLMLGLLLLNVAISGNAFTLAELQSERGLLVDRQQALEQELLLQSSPGSLAGKAERLGMVVAPQTIVLAPDGTGAPPVVEED